MLKNLYEQRNALLDKMDKIVGAAETEPRPFSEVEQRDYDEAKAEISRLDATIAALEQRQDAEIKAAGAEAAKDEPNSEERAFMSYVCDKAGTTVPEEYRSGEQNITMGNNAAIIPTSIAQRIINTVKEMCPIMQGVTMFAVKGTLKVPVYGNASTTHNINVGFSKEFTELTADAGAFTSIDLTGYLAGALTLLGKQVLNNSEINVLDFIVEEMSRRIARFIEGCLIAASTTVDSGDGTSVSGALSTTNTLNAGSTSAISADNLIELQSKIPTAYQANACWTMNPATFTAIKKLKDSSGQYLLQTAQNIVNGFPYMLLGKPVYLSDNMPAIASAAKAVLYGDYSGMGMNLRQQVEIEVLKEKYATQHAIGLVSWFEFDCKMLDSQKLAALVMSV